MDSLTNKFLASFQNTIRCFTPSMRQTYLNVLSDFRNNPETSNFESVLTQDGFEDSTSLGVAHRMYWWFPTHFFKFQDAVLRWEQNCQSKNEIFLLHRPSITFIDLGCGAGAATLAILSILEQYQDFLSNQNARVDQISVNLFGVDSFQAELDCYVQMISEYSRYLAKHKISVMIHTICQPFPEVTDTLLKQMDGYKGYGLIVGMSNLINWIWSEADPLIKQQKKDDLVLLGSEEMEALNKLATISNFEVFYVIGIVTKGRKRWWLPQKLSLLFKKLLSVLSIGTRPFNEYWEVDAKVLFENPEGSRKSRERAEASSNYYVEIIADIAPEFANDKRYQNLLSLENLERSWVKAQTWINYEAFVDRVELKLFEVDYLRELEKLKSACLEKLHEYLNKNLDLPYEFPKNEKINRPKSLARLEEQIIAVALVIEFGKEFIGRHSEVSFSFGLARIDSEFLYRYWFELYSRFVDSILENAKDKMLITTDLKSYYKEINQGILIEILNERMKVSDRSLKLISKIIDRDCHSDHETGYGILQGHSISGVLANLMLQPVDANYLKSYNMWNRYFRFTDDVTITGITSDDSALDSDEIKKFQNALNGHSPKLSINTGKTKKYNGRAEFENKVHGSRDMDGLSARFNKLLLPLFVMNNSYRKEFQKASLHFVHKYHEFLEGIGLYVTPEWLYRKLDEHRNPTKLLRSWYKIIRGNYALRFPSLPKDNGQQSKEKWGQEFESWNSNWVTEKETVRNILSAMFNSSVNALINLSNDTDTSQHARRIKFSLNRLGIFGGGDTSNQTSWMLINRPWDLNVWLACKNLGRAQLDNEISYIIENAKMSYVRAMAIKALGTVRTPLAVKKIVNILDNANDEIERLMASEALLEINLWQDVEPEQIMEWMRKDSDNPYLLKNIILILAQAYPNQFEEYLSSLDRDEILHPIINRAIHYSRTKNVSENLLLRPEPEVIRKYRAKSYPIIEELIHEDGSYKFESP